MRILLAEDDGDLADSIARLLQSYPAKVEIHADGAAADIALSKGGFDLAILDVGLPKMGGFEVLKRLRVRDKQLPALMLTARGEVADRVQGLNLGADDYVAKPFAPDELEARVRALLRRGLRSDSSKMVCGSLVLDVETRQFQLAGSPLTLRRREHDVLSTMIARPGRLLSKEQLADRVLSIDDDASLESMEIYISRLRRKLLGSDVRIVTFRGLGYMLEVNDLDQT